MHILTSDEIAFFHTNGYLVVRNVYDSEEINYARAIFDDLFNKKLWKLNKYDSESIVNDLYSYSTELADLIFNQKYFNIAKDLLGDKIILLPECAVHRNRFINWHRDTTCAENDGYTFHREINHCLLQSAIYFQDNDRHGGGLTLIPGSQSGTDRFVSYYRPYFIQRVYHKFKKYMGETIYQKIEKNENIIDIDTKKGDLLVFNLQIDHRSTFPKDKAHDKTTKYAIFNTLGNVSSPAIQYQDYLKTRPEPYYRFLNQMNHIPPILLKKAKQYDVEIYY